MEFTSIVGSQHTIEPIGYHQVRKRLRSDVKTVVRSIREQFLIHSIASDFKSTCIVIPSPIRIESSKSYIMDMVYHFAPLDPKMYKQIPDLFEELIRFKNYMYVNGYFAAGFTILHHPGVHMFVCVDFSQFGTIDSNFVMFPKIPLKYTILEAETSYGLIGGDIVTQSFKNKHIQAKSPRIAPVIQTCVLDMSELNLANEIMEDAISLERNFSESAFNIGDGDGMTGARLSTGAAVSIVLVLEKEEEEPPKTPWDKIDSFLTHVHS